MVKYLKYFVFLGCLLLPQWASAGVTATLDSYIISFGESVSLIVKTNGSVDGDPDFAPLNQNFDVLSQNQSSNYSYINGSFEQSKTWSLNLMPKQKGMLQVPPIYFGKDKTKALMLRVLDAKATQGQYTQKVWLEMSLLDKQVYVQAQNILTIKFFRVVNLSQATLSEPNIQGAVVERLGEDRNYEAVVDGRRVVVAERKYAIFPQHSGDLNVPSVQFDGVIVSGRSMFDQGKAVRVVSNALKIHVLSKPDSWGKHQEWLPAQDVLLREVWTDHQIATYKVGEPFTRTIELKATGLTSAQLPPLLDSQTKGDFKQYPDQPVLNQEFTTKGLVGIRQEKIAMVPSREGQLTLPEVKVVWWSTETHEQQTAIIAARVIDVLPNDAMPSSTNATAAMTNTKLPDTLLTQDGTTTNEVSKQPLKPQLGIGQDAPRDFWKWFALLFALSWFMTVFLWWYVSRKRIRAKQVGQHEPIRGENTKKLQKELEAGCKQHDAKLVLSLLPKWGAAFFEEENLQYLSQLQGKSSVLDDALVELNRHLYGEDVQQEWRGDKLLTAISTLDKSEEKLQQARKLHELYD